MFSATLITQAAKASIEGDIATLNTLKDKYGVNIFRQEVGGEVPFLAAAEAGNKISLEWFCGLPDFSLDIADSVGENILHKVAKTGNLDCLRYLFDNNTALELAAKAHDGSTVLHHAASVTTLGDDAHARFFAYLLSEMDRAVGRSVFEARDSKGWAVIHHLAHWGRVGSLIQWSTVYGHSLKTRTAVSDIEIGGRTILHVAALLGRDNLMRHLLFSQQLSLEDQDRLGCTPLFAAIDMGHQELCQQMLEWRAEVKKHTDNEGRTALLRAAYMGRADIVEMVLSQSYSSLDERDKERRTPLMNAVYGENNDVVIRLLVRNPSLADVDSQKRTVFHHLILSGAKIKPGNLVDLLGLDKRAILLAKDKHAKNVLHYISDSCSLSVEDKHELARYFVAEVPDLRKQKSTFFGKSRPSDLARKQGQISLIQVMRKDGQVVVQTPSKDLEEKTDALKRRGRLAAQQMERSATLTIKEELGRGTYGRVSLARLARANGVSQDVAVKEIRADSIKDGLVHILAELRKMSDLDNKNIVKLVGYDLDHARNQYALLMEYMALGPLHKLLRDPAQQIDPYLIYQIAANVLNGLVFLHENGHFHRNLKTSSILLDYNWQAKLSKLSLAHVSDMTTMLQIQLPAKQDGASKSDIMECKPKAYWAPEVHDEGLKYATAESDVYSLGMVLWEMISRRPPYFGRRELEIADHVCEGKREDMPAELDERLHALKPIIKSCWAQKPEDRSSSANVCDDLYKAWNAAYLEEEEDFADEEEIIELDNEEESVSHALVRQLEAEREEKYKQETENFKQEQVAESRSNDDAGPAEEAEYEEKTGLAQLIIAQRRKIMSKEIEPVVTNSASVSLLEKTHLRSSPEVKK